MDNSIKILKNRIDFLNIETVVKKIILSAQDNKNLTVAPIASHPLIESYFNKKLQKCFDTFDLVLPDGKSLILASRFLNGISSKRIYGPELFQRLVEKCESKKIKVLLYGNHTNETKRKLLDKYRKLKVVSFKDLKLKKLSKEDIDDLISETKKYKNCILCLGLGSPAQHFLMSELKKTDIPVIALGATFDFLSGVKKQAPIWMRKSGLEWLFRLASEPKRLWKRYLIMAPLFVLLVIAQKIKR